MSRADPKELTRGLSGKHRKLMRLLIAGYNQKEAGAFVGLGVVRVGQLVASPLFRAEMEKMRREVDAQFVREEATLPSRETAKMVLEREVPESLNCLIALRDGSQDEKVQLASAKDLLDRAGVKSAERIEAEISVNADEALSAMLATVMKDRGASETDK